MAKEVKVKVTYDTGDATKKAKELKDDTSGVTNAVDKLTGGAVSGFKSFATSISGAIKGLRAMNSVLAASGLGLLVVVLASLVQAFRNSEEGQNKWAKAMGVVNSVVGNLLDLLADLGDAVINAFENPQQALKDLGELLLSQITNRITGVLKLLPRLGKAISLAFKGEFSEAGRVAADAALQVATGVENATSKIENLIEKTQDYIKESVNEGKAAARVADMRAKADKIERKLIVERSKLESEIAQLRLKSRQEEEFSAAERRQALLDAQALEDILLEKEQEALKLRSEAISMENTFARSNKQNLDDEARAKAAVNEIEARRATQQRSTQRELNRVNKEIQREEEARAKEEVDRLKELAEMRIELILDEQEKELATLDAKYLAMEEKARGNADILAQIELKKEQELTAINAKYEKQRSDEIAKNEQAIRDSRMMTAQLTANILGNLSEVFGSSEQASKAFAIAEVLANQGIALARALANAMSPTPDNILSGGLAGIIKYGTIAASITGSVAQIKRIIGSSGGARGAGMTIPTGQTSAIPQVSRPQDIPTDFGAVRSYVLVGDVNNGQEAERRLENLSTL